MTPCAMVSGAEGAPVHSRNYNGVTIDNMFS